MLKHIRRCIRVTTLLSALTTDVKPQIVENLFPTTKIEKENNILSSRKSFEAVI